jgi:hypothetical protein
MPLEMNLPKFFRRPAPIMFALLAGFLLTPAGRAQPEPHRPNNRYLLIFDVSSDMKKRLPAVQAEVDVLMSSSMNGELLAGDSLGVWTFDQDLHTGQFPLQRWKPEDAVKIAAGVNQFVSKQHFANRTRFDALQPQLNAVIQNSERLTVLIFCDGEDEIKWTPYDAGINQAFQQRLAAQKKARQPFILVLRAQLGQYAGYTMNYADYTPGFPISMASFPEFPPLPPPPAPHAPVKTPPPAPAPTPVVKPAIGSPLIIVGTKVGTTSPPAPSPATIPAPVTPANIVPATSTKPVATSPPTNPMPVIQANTVAPAPPANQSAAAQTNLTSAAPANLFAPNNVSPVAPEKIAPVPQSNAMTSTKPVAPPPETSGPTHKTALVIGGVLLVAAGSLAALAVFRSRRTDRGSLISRAMKKD